MRVLMTADTVGGIWTYAMDLVGSLAPHGVTVALATMGAPLSSEQRAHATTRSNLTIYESRFKLEWMDNPWDDVRQAGDWLLELEQAVQPDIVHLNGYAHGHLPWSAPVLMVGHSCVLSWWQAVKGEAAPSEWNCYRENIGRGLRAADLVVAPTQAMLDELHRLYGPLPASRVIFNGRDATGFAPAEKEPFIFAAGRLWDEAKNIAALEAVASRVAWPIFVAGEDVHPDGGKAHHTAVQLLGKVDEAVLTQRMAAASIYALPARYEPFGLSALEAALCGCALVLGEVASLREVWGDAAIFVAPDNCAALERAISELIADEPRRIAQGKRARERAMLYNTQSMARGYFETYCNLTTRHSPRNRAATA